MTDGLSEDQQWEAIRLVGGVFDGRATIDDMLRCLAWYVASQLAQTPGMTEPGRLLTTLGHFNGLVLSSYEVMTEPGARLQ